MTGIILTCAVIVVIATNKNNRNDDVSYFETPISYENKKSTSFEVFQVLDDTAALAKEISNKRYGWYDGKTVLLLGEKFYKDQIIKVDAPQQVGTYTYETKQREVLGTTVGGDVVTVPVIGK